MMLWIRLLVTGDFSDLENVSSYFTQTSMFLCIITQCLHAQSKFRCAIVAMDVIWYSGEYIDIHGQFLYSY